MADKTQFRRMGLFDARVPRYTSYPPANHFAGGVGPSDTDAWIRAIPEGSRISLYVHIPFCRHLCWFCACRTQGTATMAPVRSYVDSLIAEIVLVARSLPAGIALSRLHWGGGTPTILDPQTIARLTAAISAVFPFAPDAEFSVEIDPNEIDEARLDALVEAGMTRASIGVQDFDPEIQKTIGREQSFAITKTAIDGLRARDIGSLNIDMVYGLPWQTSDRMADSVQRVLSLNPDRVALYGYAHVPWMARRQTLIPSDALPTPEERLDLFETARRLFAWDGYRTIGIDHFARREDGLAVAAAEGRLRRNFQGYTDDTAEVLLGLGASAISRFPQGHAQNHPATSEYRKRIAAGTLATSRGHVLSPDDRLRGGIIEMLMCDFRIDVATLAARLGVAPAEIARRIAGLGDAFPGMVEKTDTGIEITEAGRPMTRILAHHFDAYASPEMSHSRAI